MKRSINLTFGSLLILGYLLSSCTTNDKSVIWVNSLKSECTAGAGKMQCLSISKNDSITHAEWELLYNGIEGFDYESGYFQKIEIQEEQLDPNEVPADGSTKKYKLVKTIEKIRDHRIILNDIWLANRIIGVSTNGVPALPRMEINLSKMQVLGNNGCNNYTGAIKEITQSSIQFGTIASTRKMCPDMTLPDMYDEALNSSVTYKLNNLELTFFDGDGNELINFMKVD